MPPARSSAPAPVAQTAAEFGEPRAAAARTPPPAPAQPLRRPAARGRVPRSPAPPPAPPASPSPPPNLTRAAGEPAAAPARQPTPGSDPEPSRDGRPPAPPRFPRLPTRAGRRHQVARLARWFATSDSTPVVGVSNGVDSASPSRCCKAVARLPASPLHNVVGLVLPIGGAAPPARKSRPGPPRVRRSALGGMGGAARGRARRHRRRAGGRVGPSLRRLGRGPVPERGSNARALRRRRAPPAHGHAAVVVGTANRDGARGSATAGLRRHGRRPAHLRPAQIQGARARRAARRPRRRRRAIAFGRRVRRALRRGAMIGALRRTVEPSSGCSARARRIPRGRRLRPSRVTRSTPKPYRWAPPRFTST